MPKRGYRKFLKIIKLDLNKIKNVCSENDTVKRMKRQATNWAERSANI